MSRYETKSNVDVHITRIKNGGRGTKRIKIL